MIKVLYKEVEIDENDEIYQGDMLVELNGTEVSVRYYGCENNFEILDMDDELWNYEEISEAFENAKTDKTIRINNEL